MRTGKAAAILRRRLIATITRRANHFGLSEVMSSPLRKNKSLNTSGKSPLRICPSHPIEGRIAIVTNVRWDAVDA